MEKQPVRSPFVVMISHGENQVYAAHIAELLNDRGVQFAVLGSTCPGEAQTPSLNYLQVPEPVFSRLPPADLVLVPDESAADVLRAAGRRVLVCTGREEPPQMVGQMLRIMEQPAPAALTETLSVCIITKDEETNLSRCLLSVCGVADEIVVVDTGSSDRTVDVARRFGAKVGFRDWDWDFAAARNFSLAAATCDWILVLDADEVLTDEFRHNVKQVITGSPYDGYLTPMRDMQGEVCARVLDVTRLFRNRKGYAYKCRVHEQILPSIFGSGGKVYTADLPIAHFGYNPEEDRRKGRRERNLGLLQKGHAEDPDEPLYWHYLGCEYAAREEFRQAKFYFYKMLHERPTFLLAGWTAEHLGHVLLRSAEWRAAWDVANAGLQTHYGHLGCAVLMGRLALYEGDYVTAERCAEAIESAPASANGITARRRETVALLRAGALWERGRGADAIALLHDALKQAPGDLELAAQWVQYLDRTHGYRVAAVDALQEIRSGAVAYAASAVMARHQDWAALCQVAETARIWTPAHLQAMLRMGRTELADAAVERIGLDGARQLLLCGLELENQVMVSRALHYGLPHWAMIIDQVQRGERVAEEWAWLIREWMRLCADYSLYEAFSKLTMVLPGTPAQQIARAALAMFDAARYEQALQLAFEVADEPEAQEVIGLMAWEGEDMEVAAGYLKARALRGDARVKVYWRGAEALKALGKFREAKELLRLGREDRYLSLLLTQQA